MGQHYGVSPQIYTADPSDYDNDARLKVKIDPELSRKLGSTVDILNQMQTAEYTPIVAQKPLPNLSILRDKKVPDDASYSVVGGEINIDGSTAIHSLYTKDVGLYMPGLLGVAGIRARMATPNTGTYRQGYGNDAGDRVGLECVNGAFTTFVESGGTRWYSKPRSEWLDPLDGTGPSGISSDMNSGTLRIVIGWYGSISLLFTYLVSDRENGDRLVVFDSSGPRADDVTITQPDLPIFAEADGGVLYVGGRQYGVVGRFRPQERITSTRAITKTVADTGFVPIVSIRHKQDPKWESVRVMLSGESMLSTANAEYAVIVGGTLTGETFGAIDGIGAEETALEQDTAATAISGGYRAASAIISSGGGSKVGTEATSSIPDITIPPGEIVTLVAVSFSGTGDVTGLLRMRELW